MPAPRTTLSRLQVEADAMVNAIIVHLAPSKTNFSYVRNIEPARVKIYFEHLCFILKEIERLRGAQ